MEDKMEQLPRDKQKLMLKWLGLEKFMRYRGRLQNLMPFLEEVLLNKKSSLYCPTPRQLKNRRYFSGDMQVLAMKLAQLISHNNKEYAIEVMRALAREHYPLPGETMKAKKYNTFTLVMFSPHKTALLIRTILENVLMFDMNDYYHGAEDCSRAIHLLTHEVFQTFPSMKDYIAERIRFNKHYEFGYVTRSAYMKDVLKYYLDCIADLDLHGLFINTSQMTSSDGYGIHEMKNGRHTGISRDMGYNNLKYAWNFLFVHKGSPDEVLSQFPREFHYDIATWQLNIPSHFQGKYYQKYGLHREAEHSIWKAKAPTFVSSGISHGLGAIAIPDMPEFKEWKDEYQLYKSYRSNRPDDGKFRVIFTPR